MTRQFNSRVQCEHCGRDTSAETAFERWVRNHPQLDSRTAGIVRFDLDLLLHRYAGLIDGLGSRDIQCLMFIEVKTYGSRVTDAQRDTLFTLNQVLRNRKPNRHRAKRGAHLEDHIPLAKTYSWCNKRRVALKLFGGHSLRLSAGCPEKSAWIEWDHKAIDVDALVRLLRFEIDPDTLEPIDWRRRYVATARGVGLFACGQDRR